MKKVFLYQHSTAENHGCEALIRTISSIIDESIGESRYIVTSKDPELDKAILKDSEGRMDFVNFDNLRVASFDLRSKIYGAFSQLFHMIPFKKAVLRDVLENAESADICVSVGGDNYSYGRSCFLTTMDNYVRARCKKTVLWGCSINPEMLSGKEYRYKVEGLRRFSLITARESMTYNALKELGFDNVKLYPDPAFTLPVGEVKESMFENGKDTVGINISPLICEYEAEGNITADCYSALVRHILDNTDYNIAFISHVRCSTTDDSSAAKGIMKRFEGEERIKLFDEGNCIDLKGYISKCRFFIVARTHASIAAYSTAVPTLVVGYSVKSRGIAKDLFGTDENYVIPVQSLKEKNTLVNAFEWLRSNEAEIKNQLEKIMPEYIARAKMAGDELKRLIEE